MAQEPFAPGEDLRYCPYCGNALALRLLPTEDRPRLVCQRDHILYVNPKVIVGVIPERRRRILLMRRAIEAAIGAWTDHGVFTDAVETGGGRRGALGRVVPRAGAAGAGHRLDRLPRPRHPG